MSNAAMSTPTRLRDKSALIGADRPKKTIGLFVHCHAFVVMCGPPGPVCGWLGQAARPRSQPFHAGRCDRLGLRVGHQLPVGQRRCSGRVLKKPVEQQPAGVRVEAVEARAELLLIDLQVIGVDALRVGTQQRPFGQVGDVVHGGQQLVRVLPGPDNWARLVDEPVSARLRVGAPAVGHDGGAGLDGGDQELAQRLHLGAGDDAHPGPTVATRLGQSHRDHHQRLARRAASAHARLFAADEGFVDLAPHRDSSAASSTPFGKSPDPAASALSTQRPARSGAHVPGGGEPHRQRRPGVLKDRFRGARDPLTAPTANATPGRWSPHSPRARGPDTPAGQRSQSSQFMHA